MNLTILGKFKTRILAKLAIAGSLILFAFTLTSCGNNDNYDLWCTINGTVTDYITDSPLDNATVVLTPSGMAVQTDVDGTYVFNDLESQQYVITVQKAGYQPNRKNVQAVSGESIRVDIQLTAIPTE